MSLANLIPGLNAVSDQMIRLCQSRMLTLTSTPLEEQFVIREIKQVNQIGLTPLHNLTRVFLTNNEEQIPFNLLRITRKPDLPGL